MPKTGVFLLTQVTSGTGPHFWITFALPPERYPWAKDTCACREAAGQPSKTFRRRDSDFLTRANLSSALIGEKRRIVEPT